MFDLFRRTLVSTLTVAALPAGAIAAPAPSNLSRLLEMERDPARIMAAFDATYSQNVDAFRAMNRMRGKAQPPRQSPPPPNTGRRKDIRR